MQPEETGFYSNRQGLRLFWRRGAADGNRRGVVLIAHGYAEHSGRYPHLFPALRRAGLEVHGVDLQGHGQSEGLRGYVDQFGNFVEDLHQYYLEQIAPLRGELKFFVLGHSMGAVIAQLYGASYPNELDGLVLSGIGTRLAGTPRALTAVARGLARVVPKLAIKSHLPIDCLSHDPDVIQAYADDPLVFAPHITVRLGSELYRSTIDGARRAASLELPLLVVWGAEDTVFSGTQELFEQYRGHDKTLHRYEGGRHEVHNELPAVRDRALADLTAWLVERL